MPPTPPVPLPPLDAIIDRLDAQLENTPGGGRLTREDVITLAILAVEREATRAWTVHRAGCGMLSEGARWQRHCTCGLEAAEGRSAVLRRRLAPPEPPPDYRRRTKGGFR
jgi:hypothetical protein